MVPRMGVVSEADGHETCSVSEYDAIESLCSTTSCAEGERGELGPGLDDTPRRL